MEGVLSFFRFQFDGRMALYIFCRGGLIAAAGRLPPGALNLQGAPTFVETFGETQTARTKTTHNGKWKGPFSRGRIH